jgi:hypothetical protein
MPRSFFFPPLLKIGTSDALRLCTTTKDVVQRELLSTGVVDPQCRLPQSLPGKQNPTTGIRVGSAAFYRVSSLIHVRPCYALQKNVPTNKLRPCSDFCWLNKPFGACLNFRGFSIGATLLEIRLSPLTAAPSFRGAVHSRGVWRCVRGGGSSKGSLGDGVGETPSSKLWSLSHHQAKRVREYGTPAAQPSPSEASQTRAVRIRRIASCAKTLTGVVRCS